MSVCLATYVSEDSFTVASDQSSEFAVARAVQLIQGVDGSPWTHVSAVDYRAGTDDTLVTTDTEVVTTNLASVKVGSDTADSLPVHTHPNIPASVLSSAQVAIVQSFPIPGGAADADKLIGIGAAGTTLEKKTLQGTDKQVTVDFTTPGIAKLGGPQDLDSTASPTFAGMKLTALTGIVVANGASACGVTASSTQYEVLKRGATGYEFGLLTDDNIDPDAGIAESKLTLDYGSFYYSIADIGDGLASHINNVNNPHQVTEAQVDIDYGSHYYSVAEIGDALALHINTSDPDTAQWNANKIQDVEVDDTAPTDGYGLIYSSALGKYVPAELPGAAGGEANTISNEGGGVELYKTKVGVNLQLRTLNPDEFEVDPVTDQINSLGGGGGGCGTGWLPPGYLYKDADELYIRPGSYAPAGLRNFPGGHYENPTAQFDWTLTDALNVDIDGTYSAGATSGMIGGAKVVSSWYSLWMMSASIILVLPYIRIDNISYSAPDTTINPASQADGTTAENGFLAANDAWNTYRLQKIANDVYGGKIFTIADSVSGTPDEIIISGDMTSYLAATDWLQLCPPAGVDCVYIGDIWINSSGNLIDMSMTDFVYEQVQYQTIALIKGNAPGNTELGAFIPPTAKTMGGTVALSSDAVVNARGIILHVYSGNSGSNQKRYTRWARNASTDPLYWDAAMAIPITVPSLIRNCGAYIDSAGTEYAIPAGGACAFRIVEFIA